MCDRQKKFIYQNLQKQKYFQFLFRKYIDENRIGQLFAIFHHFENMPNSKPNYRNNFLQNFWNKFQFGKQVWNIHRDRLPKNIKLWKFQILFFYFLPENINFRLVKNFWPKMLSFGWNFDFLAFFWGDFFPKLYKNIIFNLPIYFQPVRRLFQAK